MKVEVFLFPHQDDEVFARQIIQASIKAGNTPLIFFLTSQIDSGANSRRNNESLRYLSKLGVAARNIHFAGEKLNVRDSKLIFNIGKVFRYLFQILRDKSIISIHTTAYEGGHPDHDAAAVLAFRLSELVASHPATFEFWCYNGFGTRGKFFNVKKPFRESKDLDIGNSLSDLIFVPLTPIYYLSQWKSWIGLYPGLIIQSLVSRHQQSRLDKGILSGPPHTSPLLYERYKRLSYNVFRSEVESFFSDSSLIL